MDKTHLSPPEPASSDPFFWLETWWRRQKAVPGIGFLLENGPMPPGQPATHIQWPRLMLCLEGARHYRLAAGGERRITAGEALWFTPGAWLSPREERDFRSLGVHWEPGRIRLILREESPFLPPRAVWSLPPPPGASRRLGETIRKLASRPEGRFAAGALLLLELGLLMAHAREGAAPGRRHGLYLRVCAYLEEQFALPHSRRSVAEHFGISPGHLTRLFREEGSVGFNEFLNDVRLREAGVLLASGRFSVEETALQCGFTDAGYFSRLFRKRYGTSPGRAKWRGNGPPVETPGTAGDFS